MLSITKTFEFDAAHYLPEHPGKCQNMHGHTWKVEVEVIRTDEHVHKETLMVFDFGTLKDILQTHIVSKLDHKILNDINNLDNPTAEWLCLWIEAQLSTAIGFGLRDAIKVIRVRVWESRDSYAEWRRS